MSSVNKQTPLQAIRAFCLECCGGSAEEVKNCTAGIAYRDCPPCALYPYRLQKNPYSKRKGQPKEVLDKARDKALIIQGKSKKIQRLEED